MAGDGYAHGSIAGVNLQVGMDNVKVLILDGGRLLPSRLVNSRESADGTLYVASMDHSGIGVSFGLEFEQLDFDLYQDMIGAINTSLESQDAFPVDITDGLHAIDQDCVPDGPDWLQNPPGRITSAVRGVVMRLKTAG